MTVSELFEAEKIDEHYIAKRMRDDSSYWLSCEKFVADNWNREIKTLSLKQGAWLTRILDDCVEKRIDG